MKKIALHIQILLGMALGVLFAVVSIKLKWPTSFIVYYIKPFGSIFLNSLKIIAIPLVFASLVIGVTSLEDITKLSRVGKKTFILYIVTTIIATLLGLLIANVAKPGRLLSEQTKDRLLTLYPSIEKGCTEAQPLLQKKGLQFLADLVPDNFFNTLTNNENLLQIVLLAIIIGIALLKISSRKSEPIILLLEGLNDLIIELVRFIMQLAPVGVFSLITSLLVEIVGDKQNIDIFEILYALLGYVATVIAGLGLMLFIVYPIILKMFTKVGYFKFFKGIYPTQLVAFTTSSSSATLPVSMECAEKNLGVSEEVSSFVLPLGATVNMDGSAIYQAISVVFIAQALGLDLSITAQLMIVANVTLSSIGVAGIPGSALVMTTIVLQSVGVPVAGLALIVVPERILDMCRTVTNVTGDMVVAMVVANSEGGLVTETEQEETTLLANDDY